MPLRDHFRPPLTKRRSWEGVHGAWPTMIVIGLNPRLPPRYVAEPQVHLGSSIEVDVATYEEDESGGFHGWPRRQRRRGDGGSAPPRPTLSVATDVPTVDEYEVRVYDTESGNRLVAAVEIVSPSNKDRPEHRRAFVAKCAALLQNRVCVAIVDLVTTRTSNVYGELLELFGQTDPALAGGPSPLYAVSCRWAEARPATPGCWRPGSIPCRSANRCRPCRSGSPRTSPSRSSWNQATRRRAAFFASRRRRFEDALAGILCW